VYLAVGIEWVADNIYPQSKESRGFREREIKKSQGLTYAVLHAGRTSPGKCFRLYTQEAFLALKVGNTTTSRYVLLLPNYSLIPFSLFAHI
jgi:hypothetical protein